MNSAAREKVIALFEKHRQAPGAAYDERHFMDYLVAKPKGDQRKRGFGWNFVVFFNVVMISLCVIASRWFPLFVGCSLFAIVIDTALLKLYLSQRAYGKRLLAQLQRDGK